MGLDFNVSIRSTTDPNTVIDLTGTETVDQTKGVDTLTIVENASQTDPTTGAKTVVSKTITLESPGTDLSGLDPNQLKTAMQSLQDALSSAGMATAQQMLGDQLQNLTDLINSLKTAPPQSTQDPANTKLVSQFFQQVGSMADSIYTMLQGANFQQNTKFVDAMIEVAQQLRQLSNLAQQTAIGAEFNKILDQADQIRTEADDNYNAAKEDITASYIEAGVQIASAALTIIGGALGGKYLTEADGSLSKDGIGTGSQLGGAAGSLMTGIGTMIGNIFKSEAASDRQKAGYAQAVQKVYEADQKKIQQQETIAADLLQTAVGLLDAALKLFQAVVDTQ